MEEGGAYSITVAELDGTVVGVMVWGPDAGDPEHFVVSYALGVLPDHRRQGIATALKQSVMAEVAASGVATIWSDVHHANVPMNRVNEKLGVTRQAKPDDDKYDMHLVKVVPEGKPGRRRRRSD
jgi:ribosomal protein S18 acetylase RimI-like enzyme